MLSTRSRALRAVVTLLIGLSFIACSSAGGGSSSTSPDGGGGGGGGGACGLPGRTGDTACTLHSTTCQAGAYCNPSLGTYDYCLAGCTSDNNCAANQHCLQCDTTSGAGTCQPCSVSSCTAPPSPPNSCTPLANNAGCPTPGVLYGCESGTDSPSQDAGTCAELPLSSTPVGVFSAYCCGVAVNPCTRNNRADPLCQGKKAYDCAPQPSAPATCASSPQPGTYCCPS